MGGRNREKERERKRERECVGGRERGKVLTWNYVTIAK